jgi:hypothetical protein
MIGGKNGACLLSFVSRPLAVLWPRGKRPQARRRWQLPSVVG